MSRLLKEGDVFRCPFFLNCVYKTRFRSDGHIKKDRRVLFPRVGIEHGTCRYTIKGKKHSLKISTRSRRRSKALWLVLRCASGHGSDDLYMHHGHYVVAVRLDENNSYDSKSERIKFYMSGVGKSVDPDEIELVGSDCRVSVSIAG